MSDRKKSGHTDSSDPTDQQRSGSLMGNRSGRDRSAGNAENPQDGQDIPRSNEARPRGKTEDPDLTL